MTFEKSSPADRLAMHHIHRFPGRPTIVFLHDSLGCIRLWRDFPKELGKITRCNVLVYDRQGYGRSLPFGPEKRGQDYLEKEADILIQLLDHCRLDEAILFGHSDGGSIALIAAGKYPQRISGIITEGAHIFVEEVTLNGIREAMQLFADTELPHKLSRYHGDKTRDVFRAWTETWTDPAFRSWNIEHFLGRINCPVMIIQGMEDEYGSLEQVDRIAAGVAGYTEKLVPAEARHSPHREVPALVLDRTRAFILQRIAGAATD